MKEKIIIHTDASFNNGIGGWACVIELPGDRAIKQSGILECKVDNSSMAELMAFEKAFALAHYEAGEEALHGAIVYTDSLWVVEGLRGKHVAYKGIERSHRTLMQAIIHITGHYDLDTRHVRAHATHLKTPEQIFNNWCDFTARELVRKELRELGVIRSQSV